MIEVCNASPTLSLVGDVFESSCWEVAKENVSVFRRFPSNFLRDISDCEINRVCGFISEESELGFVGGDYKWDNGSARFLFLDFQL